MHVTALAQVQTLCLLASTCPLLEQRASHCTANASIAIAEQRYPPLLTLRYCSVLRAHAVRGRLDEVRFSKPQALRLRGHAFFPSGSRPSQRDVNIWQAIAFLRGLTWNDRHPLPSSAVPRRILHGAAALAASPGARWPPPALRALCDGPPLLARRGTSCASTCAATAP